MELGIALDPVSLPFNRPALPVGSIWSRRFDSAGVAVPPAGRAPRAVDTGSRSNGQEKLGQRSGQAAVCRMNMLADLLAAPGLPPELLACESYHHAYRLTTDLQNVIGPALQSPRGFEFQQWALRQSQPERALRRVVAIAASVQAGNMSVDRAQHLLATPGDPKHRLVSLENVRDLPDTEAPPATAGDTRTGETDLAAEVLADALGAFATTTGYAPTPSATEVVRLRWSVISAALADPDQPRHPIALVGDTDQRLDACRTARRARHHLAATSHLSPRRVAAADRFLLGSTGGSPSWMTAWGAGRGASLVDRWSAGWATDLLRCDADHDRLPDAERAAAARRLRRKVRSRTAPAILPPPVPTTYLGLYLAS